MQPTTKLYLGYGAAFLFIIIVIIAVATIEKIKEKPVTHYTDKQGVDHGEKQVATADASTINVLYDHILDSVLKGIKAKQKDVEAITSVSFNSGRDIHPEIKFVPLDTCIAHYPDSVLYNDEWIHLNGSIVTKTFHYNVKDSLTFITYYKKTGLFRKELFLNAYSQNPYTTIDGITAINLHQAKPPHFGIGLQAGYSWNGTDLKPTIGIGVTYNIIRF